MSAPFVRDRTPRRVIRNGSPRVPRVRVRPSLAAGRWPGPAIVSGNPSGPVGRRARAAGPVRAAREAVGTWPDQATVEAPEGVRGSVRETRTGTPREPPRDAFVRPAETS